MYLFQLKDGGGDAGARGKFLARLYPWNSSLVKSFSYSLSLLRFLSWSCVSLYTSQKQKLVIHSLRNIITKQKPIHCE
ncbi:hypothetical protein CARUB_v10015026mg [Capsella rubella]|uniref:Uncharacterized protein n=1 Tax=Capsella rubella TaxID=81985 RepID=R0HPV3_9BRAS|nr:hypothetical protein CARUB_v10015026mg [Capsella rubella]